ncbi:MAG: hypothetical protein HZA23_03910 [Nitrospirae bacterium]|nr:hypothetical protein [Nitrospirota bacterium]
MASLIKAGEDTARATGRIPERNLFREGVGYLVDFWRDPDVATVDVSETFKQATSYTCGPAALRMALYYLGIVLSEEEVARLAGTDPMGTTLYGLAQALKAGGLDAQGERWNLPRLMQIRNPVIAFVGRDHFVLIEGVRGEEIYMFDPVIGRIKVRKHVFNRYWNGHVLVMKTRPLVLAETPRDTQFP